MPQVQLPIFPAGSVEINRELACRVEGEQVVYFNGHLPVFAHPRREGSKLNAEKLEQARALLVQGHPLVVVSAQTGVLSDTLRKAIKAGRLPAVKKTGTRQLVGPQPKAAR